MINFRYHIVSLIAVFLALAIGVIMGARGRAAVEATYSAAELVQRIEAVYRSVLS